MLNENTRERVIRERENQTRVDRHDDALENLRVAAVALIEYADRHLASDPSEDPVGALADLAAVEAVIAQVRRVAWDDDLGVLPGNPRDRLEGLLRSRPEVPNA